MRRPPCEICGSGIEPEEGAFICSSCARPRDQWLAEMARLCVLKDELVAALETAKHQLSNYPNHTYTPGRTKNWCDLCDDIDEIDAALAKAKEE